MKQITFALLGAGMRGNYAYAPYALKYPHEVKFVAVAEPDYVRRNSFVAAHDIAESNAFSDWRELLAVPQLADALLVATMDNDHVEPALRALELGYKHILLEKPIDRDMDRCRELRDAAIKHGANIQVCHSLRYTNFYRRLKEVIQSERLGRMINIAHVEGVGYYHHAHSFVRGNWGKSDETSPMILQKCCHDMDLLLYLTGRDCKSVSSYGSLSFFKPECAPEGSAERCINCAVRDECPYDATRIYAPGGHWHYDSLLPREGFDTLVDMLNNGRLGRCVFRCGNDVVDHQVVNMLFEDDVTVSMTMSAFSRKIGRETRIMCALGEIYADLEESVIELHEFATDNVERISVTYGESGHSGADDRIMRDFRRSVLGESQPFTNISVSIRSHEMSMAAEQARLTRRVIELP